MTYNELITELQSLSAEQKAKEVQVLNSDNGAYYPIYAISWNEVDGTLDKNHPYLEY